MLPTDPRELRARLAEARLLLVFTPELCGGRDPLEVLAAVAGEVDLIQVRPKPPAGPAGPAGGVGSAGTAGGASPTGTAEDAGPRHAAAGPPGEARAAYGWTLRALELLARLGLAEPPPVLVNDRVDVALALRARGCAGCHLGQDDLPIDEARALLGPEPLLGLSTHDLRQVAAAAAQPVDLLGFGPAFPTATKGYGRGVGPERCWIAHEASSVPLFPIGGITPANAGELEPIGRAAVSGAILSAPDPPAAARAIRAALLGEGA